MNFQFALRANITARPESPRESSSEDPVDDGAVNLDAVLPSTELNSVPEKAAEEAVQSEAAADKQPLTTYLKEIRSVQLLTQQQEINIAKQRKPADCKSSKPSFPRRLLGGMCSAAGKTNLATSTVIALHQYRQEEARPWFIKAATDDHRRIFCGDKQTRRSLKCTYPV